MEGAPADPPGLRQWSQVSGQSCGMLPWVWLRVNGEPLCPPPPPWGRLLGWACSPWLPASEWGSWNPRLLALEQVAGTCGSEAATLPKRRGSAEQPGTGATLGHTPRAT